MSGLTDAALVFLMLSNLMLLGSSRLAACIRFTAMQGIVLGAITLLVHGNDLTVRVVLLAFGSATLKAILFPWLLFRALRETGSRREADPFVGYSISLLAGVLLLGVSIWLGSRLPLPARPGASLIVPVAFFTILSGLFLIISRKNALSQVVGYLVMENGIFTFGISLVHEEPFLVELGVLLDVFVAVFVMGITIFHISREFDHIEIDRLSTLKDSKL